MAQRNQQLGESHHVGMWHIVTHYSNVLCSDGIRRRVDRLSEPNTYFSHPGTVKVHGVSVRGYVTDIETDDYQQDYEFHAFTYCKNHAQLPEWGN